MKIWGKVTYGDKRGKLLGFPTANVRLHKQIEEGVYCSQVKIRYSSREQSDSRRSSPQAQIIYQAVTFIGSAKTFNKNDIKSETYILDFDKTIYGVWVSITLLKKLRGNKKFVSKEALIYQMKQDKLAARKFFDKVS